MYTWCCHGYVLCPLLSCRSNQLLQGLTTNRCTWILLFQMHRQWRNEVVGPLLRIHLKKVRTDMMRKAGLWWRWKKGMGRRFLTTLWSRLRPRRPNSSLEMVAVAGLNILLKRRSSRNMKSLWCHCNTICVQYMYLFSFVYIVYGVYVSITPHHTWMVCIYPSHHIVQVHVVTFLLLYSSFSWLLALGENLNLQCIYY